jgi:hypothetical protein
MLVNHPAGTFGSAQFFEQHFVKWRHFFHCYISFSKSNGIVPVKDYRTITVLTKQDIVK